MVSELVYTEIAFLLKEGVGYFSKYETLASLVEAIRAWDKHLYPRRVCWVDALVALGIGVVISLG
jgi:hypothetical protein